MFGNTKRRGWLGSVGVALDSWSVALSPQCRPQALPEITAEAPESCPSAPQRLMRTSGSEHEHGPLPLSAAPPLACCLASASVSVWISPSSAVATGHRDRKQSFSRPQHPQTGGRTLSILPRHSSSAARLPSSSSIFTVRTFPSSSSSSSTRSIRFRTSTHSLLNTSLWLRGSLSLALAVSASLLTERELLSNPSPVSGLSAAHTIYLSGGNVILLDKNSKSSVSFLKQARGS